MKSLTLSLSLCLALCGSGCAVHYMDASTGTEHVWGVGHMKMRACAPQEKVKATVHGTDVLGIGLGKAALHGYLTLGWQRLEFIDVVDKDASVRLEWPDASFVNVRVGSEFPGTTKGSQSVLPLASTERNKP